MVTLYVFFFSTHYKNVFVDLTMDTIALSSSRGWDIFYTILFHARNLNMYFVRAAPKNDPDNHIKIFL